MDDGVPLEADIVPMSTVDATDRHCPTNNVVPSDMDHLSDKNCFEEGDDELVQCGICGFVTEVHQTFLRDPMVSGPLLYQL